MLYWLIETEEQLLKFESKKYNEVFIEPIYFNDNFHPVLNQLSALYIKPTNGDKGYMVCISHDDALSIGINKIKGILKQFEKVYVTDRKSFIQFFPYNNIIDISFDLNFELNETTKTHNYFYNKWGKKEDINKLIPIVKHYEKCENIWNKVKDNYKSDQNEFNTKLSTVFSIIESCGIKINPKLFNKWYNPTEISFNIADSTIYTQYHLHNTTGRPSNSFNGINFAALKKDDSRKTFVPKNDILVEIDLTAYHPTILSKILNFNFGNETPYEYFAREANIPLKDAKVEMIRQLYGGVYKKYENIEFFKKLKKYLDTIWEEFNKGLYSDPITGKVFYKYKLEDMTPGKLLSYIIQGRETFHNVEMMWEMLKLLRGKETQLIFYCYDSFLFDYKKGEEETLEKIKNIIKNKGLRFKTNQGKTYDFREKL